jgi:hypothetical protein
MSRSLLLCVTIDQLRAPNYGTSGASLRQEIEAIQEIVSLLRDEITQESKRSKKFSPTRPNSYEDSCSDHATLLYGRLHPYSATRQPQLLKPVRSRAMISALQADGQTVL